MRSSWAPIRARVTVGSEYLRSRSNRTTWVGGSLGSERARRSMSSTPREPSGGPVNTARRSTGPKMPESRGPKLGGARSKKNGSNGWRTTAHDEGGRPAAVARSRSLSHKNPKWSTNPGASAQVPRSRDPYIATWCRSCGISAAKVGSRNRRASSFAS